MKIKSFAFSALVAGGLAVAGQAASFNGPGITFQNFGPATPYPSTATVSGLPVAGPIASVKVTLNGLTHPRPDDIEILLVSPWGAKFVLLADAGGTTVPVNGINLTFDDTAASFVADAGPMTAGSFKPTCVDNLNNIQTEFPAPAPVNPYQTAVPRGSATFASVFGGAQNPNGAWSLYVVDDVSGADVASIASWTLDITVTASTVATVTTLGSSLNPSRLGTNVTFTATVKKQADLTAVTTGTVSFSEAGSVFAANVALNGSGLATVTTNTLSEGDHVITALYNPPASFLTSSATVTQRVDRATFRTGSFFWNPGPITLLSTVGTADVYPSHLAVSGLSGTISKVSLTVSNLTINRPDDLEFLLVAPNGASFVALSDAGGVASGVSGVTLVLDDAGASALPDATVFSTGTWKPSSYGPASLPAPAPPAPYNQAAPQGSSTFARVFDALDPNGTWSLYALDDVPGDGGTIAGGWGLTFTTSSDAPTTTTLASSANPSLLSAGVTFTATVRKQSDNSLVTVGSATFREGNTVLAGPVVLSAQGQASFSTSSLTEGRHTITADYNGSAGSFNLSSGSALQIVDRPTTVTGNVFCNLGGLSIQNSAATANVYPSRILVSGVGNSLSRVSVSLNNLTIDRPDDLQLLLVSPSGAALVLLSDAGGTLTPVVNANVVLTDTAANLVPDAGPMTAGSYRPTSVNSTAATFPLPAPASFQQAAPAGTATLSNTFGGTDPNGYWSLYVVDDVPGGSTTLGSWCLTIESPPSITCPGDIIVSNAPGQCSSSPILFTLTTNGIPQPGVICRMGGNVVTSPAVFPVGLSKVTCTATNSAGTNACSFNVIVVDAEPPVLGCSSVVVSVDPSVASTPVEFMLNVTENCAIFSLSCDPPLGFAFPAGVTTVRCTAIDTAGLSNSCSFTVRVNRTPVAHDDVFASPTNVALTFYATNLLANDVDPDGDALSLTTIDSVTSAGGMVTLAAARITYTPPLNFAGLDSFAYTIADPFGATSSALVHLIVGASGGLRLAITALGRETGLRVSGPAGVACNVLMATTPTGPWTNLAEVVLGPSGLGSYAEIVPASTATRFYRARIARVVPPGLQMWLRADGNFADSYGPYSGSPLGAIGFQPGTTGQAFDFDGNENILLLGGAPMVPPWTAALWVKRQTSFDASSALFTDSFTALKLEQWPNSLAVGITQFGIADYYFGFGAPENVWTYLVFVGTPFETQLYANGVFTGSIGVPINLPLAQIGRGIGDRLRGQFDEVQVFNRALSPVEVQSLFQNMAPAAP